MTIPGPGECRCNPIGPGLHQPYCPEYGRPERAERPRTHDHAMPFAISLRLDHMKHQIVEHISDYLDNTKDAMSAAVGEAVAAFDWKGEVRRHVHEHMHTVLSQAIEGHVRFAVQHNIALRQAVEEAVAKMFTEAYGPSPAPKTARKRR